MKSFWRLLPVLGGAVWLGACGPKAVGEPPPQTPGSVPTSADAGLPAVPLKSSGVIVPSDVKMETAPKQTTPQGPMTPATASPGGN